MNFGKTQIREELDESDMKKGAFGIFKLIREMFLKNTAFK